MKRVSCKTDLLRKMILPNTEKNVYFCIFGIAYLQLAKSYCRRVKRVMARIVVGSYQ